ncbi:MAG TPA: DUF1223 domain-containing protein [Holophagaceae bacterium]|nr:DUF1223 domain-containing protein [Holophagaceae bacterium]
MRRWCAPLFCLALLAGDTPQAPAPQTPAPPPPTAQAVKPVLLELFTSEGSANCPPADQQLIRFQKDQPVEGVRIIPLSFHVDIWDAFGWKDPFASPLFTQRQQAYNVFFEDASAYTPELVVDGAFSLVGSLEQQALTAIERMARNPKVELLIRKDGKDLTVTVPDSTGAKGSGKFEVWLAIAEDGLENDVKKGENAGQKLAHTGVVRSLQLLGAIEVGQTSFSATAKPNLAYAWKKENLRAVAWMQAVGNRHVLGVAEIRLKD